MTPLDAAESAIWHLRLFSRNILRGKRTYLAAAGILSLGLGMSLAMFSLVDAVLIRARSGGNYDCRPGGSGGMGRCTNGGWDPREISAARHPTARRGDAGCKGFLFCSWRCLAGRSRHRRNRIRASIRYLGAGSGGAWIGGDLRLRGLMVGRVLARMVRDRREKSCASLCLDRRLPERPDNFFRRILHFAIDNFGDAFLAKSRRTSTAGRLRVSLTAAAAV